jgi:hypothetical protein
MTTFSVSRISAAAVAFLLLVGLTGCSQNKFDQEVGKEEAAVKLLREVQRGDYDVVTTNELKELLNGDAEVGV